MTKITLYISVLLLSLFEHDNLRKYQTDFKNSSFYLIEELLKNVLGNLTSHCHQ